MKKLKEKFGKLALTQEEMKALKGGYNPLCGDIDCHEWAKEQCLMDGLTAGGAGWLSCVQSYSQYCRRDCYGR